MPKYQKNNEQWHITNTLSFWNTKDSNNTNDMGRTNNIHAKYNGQFTYLHIDNHSDWLNGNLNRGEYGGNFGGYKRTTSAITKQKFEEIKFMNGYNLDSNTIQKNYNVCSQNCATYSTALYNKYNKDIDRDYNPQGIFECFFPGNIYNALN